MNKSVHLHVIVSDETDSHGLGLGEWGSHISHVRGPVQHSVLERLDAQVVEAVIYKVYTVVGITHPYSWKSK